MLANKFNYFLYFYSYLKYRILLTLTLSLVVGFLDGLGLAMFLPLLEMIDGAETASAEGLGKLAFIIDGMQYLNLSLTLKTVLIIMLFFFSLKGVARFFEGYYKVIIQQYFVKKLRFSNVSHLSRFSYKAFGLSDAGRIQNTLSGETERVVTAYRAYFSTLQAGVMLAVYIGLAYSANPQFALLVTVGGLLSNFAFRFIYKRTQELSRRVTRDGHDFQGLLIQMVNYFKYLKATGLIFNFSDKLKDTIIKIEKSNKRIGIYSAFLQAVREPMVIFVVVAVIMVQVTYFNQGLGMIILSLLFFYRALTFVLSLQTEWNKFLNTSGSLENMTLFQKELYENRDHAEGEHKANFNKSIAVEHLTFDYGRTRVLEDITFRIEKNQTVAFVGESGAGKSTLVNLLSGLMPVEQGDIKIDGLSIKDISLPSYQKKIGYITQEPVIFNASIYDNVTFWSAKTDSNIARLEEVLKQASIFEFVDALEDKWDTLLGNNGVNLSGGQKQRISIARELFKDIEILIMDEATSALDSETEMFIKESIERLKQNYTILIVAHRLSTIKEADQIVLMKNGRYEAIGNFDELTKKSSNFNRMVNIQFAR